MPRVRLGDSGLLAERWNQFLKDHKFAHGEKEFDRESEKGTRSFQAAFNKKADARILTVDGIAGNMTLGCGLAFDITDDFDARLAAKLWGYSYPDIGAQTKSPLNQEQMHQVFGRIEAKPAGEPDNPERLIITNDWEAKYVRSAAIPQLNGIAGGKPKVPFHKDLTYQLTALWNAWDKAGLLPEVKSFEGTFSRRYKRGSKHELSNHCWATAFDINYSANKLNALPATPDEIGCVYRLVPVAQEFGCYWGGFYKGRLDGMHFEFTQKMSADEVDAALARITTVSGASMRRRR
ncbi:D-alanyl-D-alanine carboxypeptidase [compost metagenome]